jgi:hypothetical protein
MTGRRSRTSYAHDRPASHGAQSEQVISEVASGGANGRGKSVWVFHVAATSEVQDPESRA